MNVLCVTIEAIDETINTARTSIRLTTPGERDPNFRFPWTWQTWNARKFSTTGKLDNTRYGFIYTKIDPTIDDFPKI